MQQNRHKEDVEMKLASPPVLMELVTVLVQQLCGLMDLQ